jgi:hypothetical protein
MYRRPVIFLVSWIIVIIIHLLLLFALPGFTSD